MTLSNSRLAFKDCYELFELAMSDPKGVKVRFDKQNDALHFRHRMHQARKLDREDNKRVHPADSPMHGLSEFDKITVRIERDEHGHWLRLTKIEAQAFDIVSLSEEEDDEQQTVDGNS